MIKPSILKQFLVEPGSQVNLKDYVTDWTETEEAKELGKDVIKTTRRRRSSMKAASNSTPPRNCSTPATPTRCCIVLQAMDAAGKDGTIRHVMSGVNPQGCQVFSFKKPSAEELDHNFLWRYMKALPERGRIGIFNRSYYEDVLVVKVHPEWLGPGAARESPDKSFWEKRYEDINNFEKHLSRNGTLVLKFFLHLSKDEQKKRFLERLTNPEKHWKFSEADMAEREHWKEYSKAFEDALTATSTKRAPWWIVPADRKYVARAVVADVIVNAIQDLGLKYPEVSKEKLARLAEAKAKLEGKHEDGE